MPESKKRLDGDLLDGLIIGAGISGLLAARTLREAGHHVLVVDKGRGVGGRMASRRFGGARFDHGAQFFTCRTPEFGALVESWTAAGAVTEWCRGFEGEGAEGHSRYRGEPAMTATAKLLADAEQVLTSTRIESVAAVGDRWEIRTDDGRRFQSKVVIASAPVPQTLALLDTGAATLPGGLRAELDDVEYAPCIAVMALLSAPSGMPPPGAMTIDSGPLRWMSDNHLKGISALPALTLHASHSFSREHFEAPDEEVVALLLEAAAQYASVAVTEAQVHRWRYSEPTQGPSERFLSSEEPAPIVFCGDAFGGPRVEGAALSGLAAGRTAVAQLESKGR